MSERLKKETSKAFQTEAIIEKVQTLVDGGTKMIIVTPELSPEEMAILFSFRGKQGNLGFADRPIQEEDLDIPDIKFQDETKSPSQRFRSILYVFWEQNTNKKTPFDTFYRDYLERLINGIKEKLN